MSDALAVVFSIVILVGAIQQIRAYRRRGIRADLKKIPAVMMMVLELLLGITVVFAGAFGIGWGFNAVGLGDLGGILAFIVALSGIIALFVWYTRRAAKFKWWRRA
ncbi:MAG TPA: hypothetical protein VG651_08310 [Stellaceae bacterium]|nr:hypothetical protein [Stellaceae bacterium]